MSRRDERASRRDVLEATVGAAAVGTGFASAGLASATPGGDTDGGDADDGDGPDEYNVGYSAAGGRAAARDAASEVVREFAFDALTVRLPERAVAGLRSRPDVRYVERNGTMTADGETLPWGVDRIDADAVHQVEQGTGVDVAVLDTGIDADHDDLELNIGLGAWVDEGCDTCDYGWGDDEGHGTAVAGIVGAIEDFSDVVGVAPEVTLHSVQVCDTDDSCEHSEIAAGLEWVADQGYEVANMSLSGGYSDVVSDAVAYATDRDVLMVGSAGNDGPCTDCVNHPATEPAVVAVSAFTADGDLADYSNRGPEIDLAAPTTVETTALGGGTTFFGGTSAAAPHVSGAAVFARVVAGDRGDAMRLLADKAEDVGLSGNEQGHGLVDAGSIYNDPWVLTDGVSVGENSATLHGDLRYLGLNDTVTVYFEWGLQGGLVASTTDPQTMDLPGSYSADLTGLDCETWHSYRAVVEWDGGETYRSDTTDFTTGICSGGCTNDTINTNRICTQDGTSDD